MRPVTYRIAALALGSIICSIAINGFIRPLGLLSGGAAGVSIIINHLSGINLGLVLAMINIPLFMLAYKMLKREFVLYSLWSMGIFSVFLGITGGISRYIGVDNVLLSAIIGGTLNGIGVGINFRARGSQGGIDIIGAIFRKKWDISLGTTSLSINLCITAIGGLLFGRESFYYTIIVMYCTSLFIDKVQRRFETKKSVLIISDSQDEIAHALMKEMNRAITLLKGEGGYHKKEKNVIYTIVNPSEIGKIKMIVGRYDKNAFISVIETSDVKGYRFAERFI